MRKSLSITELSQSLRKAMASSSQSVPKLYYFDNRGRAELIRLMFTLKGEPFEDIRLTDEQWEVFKPKTPFGTLPVLEIEGKRYGQSIALYNYVARELGYYGSTNKEALEIDQVIQLLTDLVYLYLKVVDFEDEEKKARGLNQFFEIIAPRYLTHLSTLLLANDTGFFVGNSITLADLAAYEFLTWLEKRRPGMMSKFPLIKSLCERVLLIPNIRNYVAKRRESII